LKENLKDVCISRKGANWGIDFPNDKDYKIWVWIDALINYISGAKEKWPADLHVIGKGINWFHSVIWPALLMSAKIDLPKKLLVHGYISLGGKKMSKSLGNVIDPLELLNKYQTDSVRYSLLKCSVFEDSDFSEEILIARHNNELANKFGNLISRVSTLAEKYGIQTTENKLAKKLKLKEIEKFIENFELDKALNLIFEFIDSCNEYVQSKTPWETKDKKVLYELSDSIRIISILLWPFMPETCEDIAKQFNFEIKSLEDCKPCLLKPGKIKKEEILFKKIGEVSHDRDRSLIKKEKLIKQEIPGIINVANVQFSEWQKLDLRVGTILNVKQHPNADKLILLEIDLGKEKKTLVAGLKQYYSEKELKGKQCIVFTNLEPREVRGIKSEGMILAAVSEDHSKVFLIQPDKKIEPGSKVS